MSVELNDYIRQPLDPGTPVLVVLRLLGRQGWSRGQLPDWHTETSDKTFGQEKFVHRKPYLQCLLILDQLRQRGLQELSSSQPIAYYRALLHSPSPASIPLGKKCDEYIVAMARDVARGHVSPLAMEALMAPCSDVEEEDTFEGNFDDPASGEEALPQDRPIVCPVSEGQLVVATDTPGQLAYRMDSVDVSGIVVNLGWPFEYVPRLRNVRLEEHLQPGQPGHYRRLIMTCPLAHCRHRQAGKGECQKKRNIGQSQTAAFGDREPEAFLGAWAAAASQFEARQSHVRWAPPRNVVRDFMVSQNWLQG
jgi:hypothetical protein